MSEPTPEQVVEAVHRAGLLLEQETATVLERLGFHVQTNRAFEDPDEEKSREMDVWAVRRLLSKEGKIQVFALFLCECKSGEAPYVFVGRPKTEIDRGRSPEEYFFSVGEFRVPFEGHPNTYRVIPAFKHLNLAEHHYWYTDADKAVQVTRMYRKKEWQADNRGIYDSLLYPLAKALRAEQKKLRKPKPEDTQLVELFFPLVVVRADMYFVDATQEPLTPTPMQHVTLTRELRARTIEGIFNFDFVHIDYLEQFVTRKALVFADQVVRLAELPKSPLVPGAKE